MRRLPARVTLEAVLRFLSRSRSSKGGSLDYRLLGVFFGKGMADQGDILGLASWNNSDGLWGTGPGLTYLIFGTQLN